MRKNTQSLVVIYSQLDQTAHKKMQGVDITNVLPNNKDAPTIQ